MAAPNSTATNGSAVASRPLHIAIDASRTTVASRTGTEHYALEIIRALIDLKSQHRLTLYFRDRPQPNLFNTSPHVRQKVIDVPRLWTHYGFARELLRERPDITFVPAHTLPIFFPGKAVVTVHDLGYRMFPQAHPASQRAYLDRTTRYSANRATRVLTDSAATRDDLIEAYQIAANKIDVVYPGVEALTRATPAQVASVRAKYKLPERYLLFLGTLQPRKNLARLMAAYADYLNQGGDPSVQLVIAGKRGWLVDDVFAAIPQTAKARIHFIGYVNDADIGMLYSGALALTFPSLYEGFGFPVLEAMRCGTPVLCSNTSSLPELVGEAALLVNPLEIAEIREGIQRLVKDQPLREQLIQRGAKQVARFTWAQAARQTLATLEAAAR